MGVVGNLGHADTCDRGAVSAEMYAYLEREQDGSSTRAPACSRRLSFIESLTLARPFMRFLIFLFVDTSVYYGAHVGALWAPGSFVLLGAVLLRRFWGSVLLASPARFRDLGSFVTHKGCAVHWLHKGISN